MKILTAKEARRAYMKAWRDSHPDYLKQQKDYNRNWRQRNKEKVSQYAVSYWERKALTINAKEANENSTS